MKPRQERTRSTTSSTYSPPLVSQPQDAGDANGCVTEQDAVAQPEESVVVRPPPTTTDMGERVRLLEREAAAAKQREMKVLESLVQQTKEMERAKVALEESRLEVAALRRQQHGEGAAAQQWSVMDLMFGGVDQEINGLRTKLCAEREQALEALRRDNDGLRASEAAARERADELQARLAAAKEREVPLPLVEKWKREDAQGKLGAAAFLDSGRLGPGPGRKDRMFASLSNLAELKSAAAAAAALDDYGYEFDHLDLGQYGDATERKVNKRRSILRKFGDLFRRSRSLYKPNLVPVLHNHY